MKSKKQDINWNERMQKVLEGIKSGEELNGKTGILNGLIKDVIEASLEGELNYHLSQNRPNRRNGHVRKQLKTDYGTIEIESDRDRDGSFEPQLIKKRQTTLGKGIDQKIISLFGLGMSYRDISNHIHEMYGVDVSIGLISSITDQLLPVIDEWRSRVLESVYPIIFLDGIYFKSRNEETAEVVTKVAYSALGINNDGNKELLGVYIWEGSESAKLWMQVLNDLKERGVKDILIACTDNLTGFQEAIEAIYPQTDVQLCIVHQLRNTMKYLSWQDTRALLNDLKKVYRAPSKATAEHQLEEFSVTWGKRYPPVVKSWQQNWNALSHYFIYDSAIRRMIYTTNIVEGFHRNVRKRTKTKAGFTSDKAILKLIYLTQEEMKNKWGKAKGWNEILLQLKLKFGDRLN